jgi:hypothetical protein
MVRVEAMLHGIRSHGERFGLGLLISFKAR